MIAEYSPISISLEGAKDASDAINNLVVPWRREHAKKIANLEEQEKITEIEVLKAESLEKRARAQRDRSDALKLEAEAILIRAEAEKINLENEKTHLEIQKAKLKLAIEIIDKYADNLPETEKSVFVEKLLHPIGFLTSKTSPLSE